MDTRRIAVLLSATYYMYIKRYLTRGAVVNYHSIVCTGANKSKTN